VASADFTKACARFLEKRSRYSPAGDSIRGLDVAQGGPARRCDADHRWANGYIGSAVARHVATRVWTRSRRSRTQRGERAGNSPRPGSVPVPGSLTDLAGLARNGRRSSMPRCSLRSYPFEEEPSVLAAMLSAYDRQRAAFRVHLGNGRALDRDA
jgi:hypothetical protein